MCEVPAQQKRRGGAMKRTLVAVSAVAAVAALVSLWLYEPMDQPYTFLAMFQSDDADTGSDHSALIGAVAGASLVLILQVLFLVLMKRMAHSRGSTNSISGSEHPRSLPMDLAALLERGHSTDVTFTVGDSQLRAHRAVLVARSDVFAAMMAHDCLETTSGHITVTDMELDVLRHLLVFMYTDKAQLSPVMASKLLVAADKYQVQALKEECEHVISRNLCVENAAECAVLAMTHSCSYLIGPAARFIAVHFKEVMATDGWADAVRKYPDVVVEISCLVAEVSTGTR